MLPRCRVLSPWFFSISKRDIKTYKIILLFRKSSKKNKITRQEIYEIKKIDSNSKTEESEKIEKRTRIITMLL